jgi:alpha-beta hydrolase superfamily lysophospholipase
MEEKWSLKTSDGHRIHGALNKADKKKNTKAILHIHGLGQKIYGYPQTVMAHSFTKQGYDVIRPSLYSWEKQARSMVDCTIKIHAADTNLVIQYFRKKYKKLYAVGHSYGGPSLMEADINAFAAVSLWDPTYIPQKTVVKKDYTKSGKYYLSLEGATGILGQPLLDEAAGFTKAYASKLSAKCSAPLQVIYAGDGYWVGQRGSFHTYAKGPTDERTIKGSQHFFHEEGTAEKLLQYTKKWFDKF